MERGSRAVPKGRGAVGNPAGRFERLRLEDVPEERVEEEDVPATQLFRDSARSIVTRNDSPDIGFSASINPYRGCEHGCAYCYARPNHEYLGRTEPRLRRGRGIRA